MDKNITVVEALKTIARFWSVLSIALILLFIFGEGVDPSMLTYIEWLGFFFFPFGLTVGLIIAWSKELIGGIVAIISLIAFSVLMNFNWYVVALGFPGILFILHNILEKDKIIKEK
jgi:hypothetical protein